MTSRGPEELHELSRGCSRPECHVNLSPSLWLSILNASCLLCCGRSCGCLSFGTSMFYLGTQLRHILGGLLGLHLGLLSPLHDLIQFLHQGDLLSLALGQLDLGSL